MVQIVCQSCPEYLIFKVCEFKWKMCSGKVTCIGLVSRIEVFPLLRTGSLDNGKTDQGCEVHFREAEMSFNVFFCFGFTSRFLFHVSCAAQEQLSSEKLCGQGLEGPGFTIPFLGSSEFSSDREGC